MKAQKETLDQGSGAPENQGLAATETQEPTTRHVGDEVEDGLALETPTGRNIIVAIGINEYQHHPALDNPINDAQAVRTLFKQCGFEELPNVPSLVANDATRAAIAALPEQLADELLLDDNLVLFFAGHGDKKERQAPDPAQPGKTYTHRTGYLIPVDGPKDKPGEWIKLDGFLDEISGLPARHIFVILDACKSGIALDEKFKHRGGDEPVAIAELQQRPSRRVMTSAMHDQKAIEGGSGSGHSVFAEAVIAAVQDRQADKDGDGFIKTWDLFSFVQDRVSERAKTLFRLEQTPDYGYLPGDGSGDLVISLRGGSFNRLIGEALSAMLRHDVPRLEGLLQQLTAANPHHPTARYLEFRLKFMQGDIETATEIMSAWRYAYTSPGTFPLSQWALSTLSLQLDYWGPALSIPSGKPLIEILMLTGENHTDLHNAPQMLCPVGNAYQVKNGACAQFQVTNLSQTHLFLYFITIVPTGSIEVGPLLDRRYCNVSCVEPQGTDVGRVFRVRGLPGNVIETRIFCSSEEIRDMESPPTLPMKSASESVPDLSQIEIEMLTIWYQIHEDMLSGPVDIATIESAFAL